MEDKYGANPPHAMQAEANRKALLLEEQVGELQKEAVSAAADSAAVLEAASLGSLQKIAALKVWPTMSLILVP